MNDTLLQQKAIDRFDQLRFQARVYRWWNRLRRQPQTLLPLAPIREQLPYAQTLPQGIQMVPVRQIVGSVQRAHDYDRQLRPLNDTLRNRWVNVNVLNEITGWAPVELVRVGNLYFVMDGHHRISVARHSGLEFVEANVTAYPLPLNFDVQDSLATVLDELHTYSCALDERDTAAATGIRQGSACMPIPEPA